MKQPKRRYVVVDEAACYISGPIKSLRSAQKVAKFWEIFGGPYDQPKHGTIYRLVEVRGKREWVGSQRFKRRLTQVYDKKAKILVTVRGKRERKR